jgi:hypothetical protein
MVAEAHLARWAALPVLRRSEQKGVQVSAERLEVQPAPAAGVAPEYRRLPARAAQPGGAAAHQPERTVT